MVGARRSIHLSFCLTQSGVDKDYRVCGVEPTRAKKQDKQDVLHRSSKFWLMEIVG